MNDTTRLPSFRLLTCGVLVLATATVLAGAPAATDEVRSARVLFLGNSSYAETAGGLTPIGGDCAVAGGQCEALNRFNALGVAGGRADWYWPGFTANGRLGRLLRMLQLHYVVLLGNLDAVVVPVPFGPRSDPQVRD